MGLPPAARTPSAVGDATLPVVAGFEQPLEILEGGGTKDLGLGGKHLRYPVDDMTEIPAAAEPG